MAHMLDTNADGSARMVSFNTNPWHGLGKVVDIEMNDDELIRNAGLDWKVTEDAVVAALPKLAEDATEEEKADYAAKCAANNGKPIRGYKLLRRSEDNKQFSVVSSGYRVFQNTELVQLMRAISANTPVMWETAGAMHGGQTVWILGRLPDLKITVNGNDVTQPYMLLTNGHGNKRPLQVLPTAIRVVCNNTLSMANGSKDDQIVRSGNTRRRDTSAEAASAGYALKHTSGLDAALNDVVEAYASIIESSRATQRVFDKMISVALAGTKTTEYWDKVFGDKPNEVEAPTLYEKYIDRNRELNRILASPTCESGRGTLYAAYQAATEFVDHGRVAHKRTLRTDSGLSNIAMGSGWNQKIDAYTEALALVA